MLFPEEKQHRIGVAGRFGGGGVRTSPGMASRTQQPIWSTGLSASGPITAARAMDFDSGNRLPSFLSNTALSVASWRARSSASGANMAEEGGGGGMGLSNRPSRNLMRRMLRTASSTSLTSNLPAAMSAGKWS